jgi:hypothetical protein
VTVSGLDFGVGEHTATVGLNGAGRGDVGVCFSLSWTSATTLACLSNESRNILMVATVTVAVMSGTGQLIFSFDGALPFTPLSAAVRKWSCLCSSGRKQGCGQRRSKRQRHSHDKWAELRHCRPNGDGLARHGGCVPQQCVDFRDDGRVCPTSV